MNTETKRRSIVKALTYRVFIVCLDFGAIYLFTHKVEVALSSATCTRRSGTFCTSGSGRASGGGRRRQTLPSREMSWDRTAHEPISARVAPTGVEGEKADVPTRDLFFLR